MPRAGLKAISLALPSHLRTNEYWQRNHPEVVAGAADKILKRIWEQKQSSKQDPFEAAMAAHLEDPFQGARERRWLGPEETVLSLELKAARQALEAARVSVNDVDLALVCSFLPDQIGVGNAAFLAQRLELKCPAWNLETACTSSLAALQTANAFIRSGQFRNVLVIISCAYSRVVDDASTLAFSVGDAASAMLVGEVPEGEGLLGFHTINTAQSCGAMYYEQVQAGGEGVVRMRAGKSANTAIRAIAIQALPECCHGAAQAAGVSLEEIDYFALALPLAWSAQWAPQALGFAPEKIINTHPLFANIGPALMPANLFHALHQKRIKQGDLVMMHTVGVVSNASSGVMRWGNVAVGPAPEPPTHRD